MTKDQEATPRRREVLKLAGLGAAAAASAVVATGPADATTGTGEVSAGYRETAHVKKVYELARF